MVAGACVSSGLGGSENSEYSSSPRSGNTYFGQNQFGGGLNQPGGGSQSQFGGGLGQYGDQGQQGRHHGKGPKGYKRSDERIKEDVNERLDGTIRISTPVRSKCR